MAYGKLYTEQDAEILIVIGLFVSEQIVAAANSKRKTQLKITEMPAWPE